MDVLDRKGVIKDLDTIRAPVHARTGRGVEAVARQHDFVPEPILAAMLEQVREHADHPAHLVGQHRDHGRHRRHRRHAAFVLQAAAART